MHSLYQTVNQRFCSAHPEIDGLVLVQSDDEHPEPPVGEIVPVRITTALEYDLVGSPVSA